MKLSQLSKKPQLIKLELSDEETVKEFGEPLEFYSWDRQPLDTFMKLASVVNNDPSSVIGIVKTLILDEEGREIISKDNMLPSNVLLKVISKIVETLGK
jgi:hypothetical protein